jgi:hypothetical protein
MREIYHNYEKQTDLTKNGEVITLNYKIRIKPINDQTNNNSKSFQSNISGNNIYKNIRKTLYSLLNPCKQNKNECKFEYAFQYLEIFTIGLLIYLLYKNLFDIFIKHIFYFLSTEYLNLEYLLLSLGSIFQIGLVLASLIYIYIYNNDKIDAFTCIALASQFSAFILFGFSQFFHNMTIWDHKFRLNILFNCELAKFLVELFFVCFFLTYKSLKYFIFIDYN